MSGPPLALRLDDRRVAGCRALAERGVLAQPLRSRAPGRPPCRAGGGVARTSAGRRSSAWLSSGRLAVHPGADVGAAPAGRRRRPAPPGPGVVLPAPLAEGDVGHQRRLGLAAARSAPAAAARRARGGRRAKSGGIESGARVVTWNSSGASRVRPKVRVRLRRRCRRPAPAAGRRIASVGSGGSVIAASISRTPRRRQDGRGGAAAQPVQHQRATPQTIAASATLNTYQDQPKAWAWMKSTTAPKRSRSITLPTAPPAMAPSATATSRARPGAARPRAPPTTASATAASSQGSERAAAGAGRR